MNADPTTRAEAAGRALTELVHEYGEWKAERRDSAIYTMEKLGAFLDVLGRTPPVRLSQPPTPDAGEADLTPYKDALHDLVMLRSEEWAIGGGPGFKERLEKAWRAAEELFEP